MKDDDFEFHQQNLAASTVALFFSYYLRVHATETFCQMYHIYPHPCFIIRDARETEERIDKINKTRETLEQYLEIFG